MKFETMKISFTILLSIWCALVFCQDTIVVQTLTFDSTKRSGYFKFPDDPNAEYAKILMLYGMKCHNTSTTGCGEWDYSCNTFITDTSNQDLIRAKKYKYYISNNPGAEFSFRYDSSKTILRRKEQQITVNPNANITVKPTILGNATFKFSKGKETSLYFVITAAELATALGNNPNLTGMQLYFNNTISNLEKFKIKCKHISTSNIQIADLQSGFNELYYYSHKQIPMGPSAFHFNKSFNWNTLDNILVQISFHQDEIISSDIEYLGENTGSLLTHGRDRYLQCSGSEWLHAPNTAFATIKDEVTIAFWTKGDARKIPSKNTTIFEAGLKNNQRIINIHLPWSDQNIYWDCGGTGSGYDRISKKAPSTAMHSNWTHWAFTKNAKTGNMSIYLNGSLWHSENGKSIPIGQITKNCIGTNLDNGLGYFGGLDDFGIWDSALDSTVIQTIMRQSMHNVAKTHLTFGLNFDLYQQQQIQDVSGITPTSLELVGQAVFQEHNADQSIKNIAPLNFRPKLDLLSGTYSKNIQDVFIYDTTINPATTIIEFEIQNNTPVAIDTFYLHAGSVDFVIDEAGKHIDSTNLIVDDVITNAYLFYYNSISAKYELLSLVTPYGNGLNLGPNGKTFTIDVSDFAPILKGNKFLSLELGGENQEKMDIKFLFIKGKSPRKVLGIQNIWPFDRGNYDQITSNEKFEEKQIQLPPATSYKIRSSITGHGQNGEFVKRNHFININGGNKEFTYDVWKECSNIPIFPQGGTWLFDRAGWCPGDPSQLTELDITPFVKSGEQASIDYGVQAGTLTEANYLVSTQLVSYGPLQYQTELALTDIIRPSDRVEFMRINPACLSPMIRIKNEGANKITTVNINYGIEGGVVEQFSWSGNLSFLQSADITLPITKVDFWQILQANPNAMFYAHITSVNNGTDENPVNNMLKSPIATAPIFKGKLQLECLTNSRGSETSYTVKDSKGNIIVNRRNLFSNTTYMDDLELAPGCYNIEIQDSGDDGLYYWYYDRTGQNVGRGQFRLKRYNTSGAAIPIVTFQPEFGRFLSYDFVIDGLVNTNDESLLQAFSVYPNPASEQLYVDIKLQKSEDLLIQLKDVHGKVIHSMSRHVGVNETTIEIDCHLLKAGVYYISVHGNKLAKSVPVVITK